MENKPCSITKRSFGSDTCTIGAYCVKKLEPYCYRKGCIHAKILRTHAIDENEKMSKHCLKGLRSYRYGKEKSSYAVASLFTLE